MPTFPKEFLERLMQEVGDDDELEAVLEGLGLNITTADNMNVVSLEDDDDDDYYGDGGQLRLPKADIETYVQEVNKDQLVYIAKRFDPNHSAKTVEPLKKVINKALKSPKHIKAVIDNLNPLEQELLREVKRRGGVVNGWGLILHAVQLGLHPEPVTDTSLYRVDAAKHPGVKFLIPLIRDCLVLPNSTYSSWFERRYYGYEQNLDIDNDILQVDERILDALSEKASPKPLAPKFKVLKDIDDAGFSQKHPIEAVLKFIEVLKLVDASGGLQTNKDGSISKNALKKLAKLAPWLEEELEYYIGLVQSLDFLDSILENGKTVLKVDSQLFQVILNMPTEIAYCMLFDGYVHSRARKYNSDGYSYGLDKVIDIDLARRVLLDTVSLLPSDAVDLDKALDVMWKERLQYVVKSQQTSGYFGRSNNNQPPTMPKWFRHDILQELYQFGLIGFKETGKKETSKIHVATKYHPKEILQLDTTNYAIKTTPAKEWWHRGRAFNKALAVEMQRLGKPKNEAEAKKLTETLSQKLAAEHLVKPDASQKALLIQANFDILVYLDMLSPLAIAALSCADCTRIDAQTANYTISRSSTYRALETGLTLETIIELLENNSYDVPNNVKVSISEWAGRRERLSVTENTNLLEYPTAKERDAALKKLGASQAVAERFLLVPESSETHVVVTTYHNYRAEPKRIIEFQDDGNFTLKGASDLAGRAVLATLAEQTKDGGYKLSIKAIQSGVFTKVAKESLLKRTKGSLPTQLSVLIDIWSGKTSAPAVGQVSVFQHASAKDLAQHPSIAPLLDGQLGTTSFLVKEGKATELNKALKALGITAAKAVEQNLEPKVVQKEESMKKGLPTRKMREMIETAIATERNLKLKYNEEKHTYDRYGYTRVSKGKAISEEIAPDSVYYEGSTPYFYGKSLKNDKGRDIRIGYITEISVL